MSTRPDSEKLKQNLIRMKAAGFKCPAVVAIEPVEKIVYVYATIEMGPVNLIKYVNGVPQWLPDSAPVSKTGEKDDTFSEIKMGAFVMEEHKPPAPGLADKPHFLETVTLGQKTSDKFTSAVRFGLADDNRIGGKAHVATWVSDGNINYFGMHASPNTPYDFKMKLDLVKAQMTVCVSGCGEDDWFMLAEDVPLMNAVKAINQVHVQQYPDGPVIKNLIVQGKPWPEGEKVRPHPLAKKDRVVGPGRGFKFQSMRSLWRKPGRHVTIARKEGYHMAFTDVAQAGPEHLVCVWNNFSHTMAGGHLDDTSIAHSYDLGRTWSEPVKSPGGGRICRLKDGTLLLDFYNSADGGKTWTKMFSLDSAKTAVENEAPGPGSHLRELPDGSWMIVGSHYPGGKPFTGTKGETLDFYLSKDRGQSWQVISSLQPYPPHSICEASILVRPDNRLILYAREARIDSFPGIKAFSSDNGKTWKVEELPFAIVGRTCAGYLADGRVMLTFRAQIGRPALWAWIGDPYDTTQFTAAGAHYNDRNSVGLKDGELHIDNDGMCGQYTTYFLRQPDSEKSNIDVTVEVKVVRNDGHAATLGVPFVGKLRLFPDRIELAHDPSIRVEVVGGKFHTYRVVREADTATIYVDGKMVIKTNKVDAKIDSVGWTPTKSSPYSLAFGNEVENVPPMDLSVVLPKDIPPEVTGYSIWRRAEVITDDPLTGQVRTSWSAEHDGFPDQYQLDNIIEVEASNLGIEQGYSGWVQFEDGRIFVVNYTDDTAAASRPDHYSQGIPWIRGTYILPLDLPPAKR